MHNDKPGHQHPKNGDRQHALRGAASAPNVHFPYAKPKLERLGTVEELTHVPKIPGVGDKPTLMLSGI